MMTVECGEWPNVIINQDILHVICVCMGHVCINFGLNSDHMISPLHTNIFEKDWEIIINIMCLNYTEPLKQTQFVVPAEKPLCRLSHSILKPLSKSNDILQNCNCPPTHPSCESQIPYLSTLI